MLFLLASYLYKEKTSFAAEGLKLRRIYASLYKEKILA